MSCDTDIRGAAGFRNAQICKELHFRHFNEKRTLREWNISILDCSIGQEILGLVWYGKDHWRHWPIASHLNPVHILSVYLLQMHYNILSSILRSSKTSCTQFLVFSKIINYSCIQCHPSLFQSPCRKYEVFSFHWFEFSVDPCNLQDQPPMNTFNSNARRSEHNYTIVKHRQNGGSALNNTFFTSVGCDRDL
jgi:hypothetical protein